MQCGERYRYAIMAVPFVCLWEVLMAANPSVDVHRPTDWSLWHKYRTSVQHPATLVKAEDLARARRNVERYEWARGYLARVRRSADAVVGQMTPDYLASMLEITTPGCVGPCPACRAKGLPWHPNGQWSWNPSRPEQLTCRVCKTVFPHPDHPESVVVRSTWDPRQEFSFIGGETFRCFGYHYARPSLSGIIRARKVGHVTSQLHTAATAYALTGDVRYAAAAKAILLRLAEVLPKYLVRAGYGYGEYTDCDPHVAAERIGNLPNDELVYPPNRPNRQLYAGYWAASRVGSSGMDGGWVSRVTEAYDLTCTARTGDTPVYSESERIRIERDVLLESSYLAACDTRINNKSVGNRAGAAMVGLCVGHPGLVRFGLDGFVKTVEDWFLPDGGTSESPAYAMMTMGGIRPFGFAFRDYTEPEDYVGPDGARITGFNAARDTRYGDCWQSLLWTLQGNLRHAPSADSYRTTSISLPYAELIALAYPTEEHLAFLKEKAGPQAAGGRDALLYREPGLEDRDLPSFSVADVVFPFLAQGYVRRGPLGRQGLALLNASDWGGHHHHDSLDLYYWQDGHELLSDLGYLWDHPDSSKTKRTMAHNLVLVDGESQVSKGRGGSFHLFAITPAVKVMEAASKAYPTVDEYRRTCVQVERGDAGSYLLDIFRVHGGRVREYLFHGPNNDYEVTGLEMASPAARAPRALRFAVRFHLPALGQFEVARARLTELDAAGNERQLHPSPTPLPERSDGKPSGWGLYVGNGKADWGRADADGAVRFAATAADKDGRVNSALILGGSDGYRGHGALQGVVGRTYRLRFAIRGNADRVGLGFVMWPSEPKSPADRVHGGATVKGSVPVRAGTEWIEHEATFTLPGQDTRLANAREALGTRPWQITWRLDDAYHFSAMSPGADGETVMIGDGWGQRDHRNSDRGATLPYVIRRRKKAGAADAFVSVFAGQRSGQAPARSVRRLAVDATAAGSPVAVAVETTHGTDIIVSQLTSDLLSVDTPAGQLTTDARAALVSVSDGGVTQAVMVGGTQLRVAGVELGAEHGLISGQVRGTDSAKGDSCFVLDRLLPADATLQGATLMVTGADGMTRAYPIRGIEEGDGTSRIYTKRGHVGFEARPAESYEILTVASLRRR